MAPKESVENPGESANHPSCAIGKSETCRVVCRPRLSFSLTSPVSLSACGQECVEQARLARLPTDRPGSRLALERSL